MKVKYWWKESESLRDGFMRPKCDCAEALDDFKGLVFSFLNDDEGLGLEYLSKWIDDGLTEIEKIKVGELNYYDMWGQAWGADITKENVLIYWGYDDTNYEESLSFECFYKLVRKWSEFLKTEPRIDQVVEFEYE